MDKTKERKRWVIILLVGLVLSSNLFWIMDRQKGQKKMDTLQTELTKVKGNSLHLENEVEKLSTEYDQLYQEKNGQANEHLLAAANELFSYTSEYDTSKKEDSIANRKKKAEKLTTRAALETLFPKDTDKGVSTITSVSKIEGNEGKPEVYLMSSDEKEVKALILVQYSISIAGSEKIEGSSMYKTTFDPRTQLFTEIKNLGEVQPT